MHSPAFESLLTSDSSDKTKQTSGTSFHIQALLQHLQEQHLKEQPGHADRLQAHDESLKHVPSDVTAFMVFFSHWVRRKFSQIEISGLSQLDSSQHHIFISNHRDILLDPILVNHALLSHRCSAARCVIGSNLTEDAAMATFMRMAGCLEVPRGKMPLKQKFVALRTLSQQIQQTLSQHNVWIAHREGRAKDGIDVTNPSVIKMLTMAKPRHQSLSEFLTTQSLIPVSISYQWDPSDTHKAVETSLKSLSDSEHDAPLRTDTMEHLIDSLDRCQGKVSLHFGRPLDTKDSVEELAQSVDQHIIDYYRLYDTHLAAHQLTSHHSNSSVEDALSSLPKHLSEAAIQLQQRASTLPQSARSNLIESYANSYRHVTTSGKYTKEIFTEGKFKA